MKLSYKLVTLFALLALLLLPTTVAFAKGPADGKVIFGGSYTLKSGDTLNGDLVMLGGAASIEKNATVTGSVVVMGGSVEVNGKVEGDILIIGGSVALGSAAVVDGNIATVGGGLSRDPGAVVNGTITNSNGPVLDFSSQSGDGNFIAPFIPRALPRAVFNPADIKLDFNPLLDFLNAFGQALVLGLLAALLVVFLPNAATRVGQAAVTQPLVAGGLGCLTIIFAPVAILLLALLSLTIILIPLTVTLIIIIAIALAAAFIFGEIALGLEVGQRIARAFKWEWPLPFAAGFGTFLLVLVVNAIGGLFFCFGWWVPTLVAVLALGAVAMTRFGMQAVGAPIAPISGVVEAVQPEEPGEPLPPAN
jgi:cytoskeletal protein CcmA (bactofilin family)